MITNGQWTLTPNASHGAWCRRRPQESDTDAGSHRGPPCRSCGAPVAMAMRFGDVVAVDGIDLDIHDGEFMTLLGPPARARRPCCA